MLIKHFKKLLYLSIVLGVFDANAGSYEDFFVALTTDRAAFVSDLLKRGFDPNTRDRKGQPGLVVAIESHSFQAARALMASPDFDINELNLNGESALMLAALKGDLPGVQFLVDAGAKVDQPGWSALHYAATGPEPKVVQLLIDHGADLNAPSPNGTTPLMMAAQYGDVRNVYLLLDRGADASRRNQKGLGVLDFAKLSGRAPLVERLERIQK
jgi:uncharacterized protein